MTKEIEILPANYTVCMYVRLSREDEDRGWKKESGSITAQRMLIRNFLENHREFRNCRVIERCDDGLSGRLFDTRPGFTDMIELCKAGRVNCIIVKDCSRFGRDYVELGDYLEQLFPFLGVRFISINDHFDSAKQDAGLDIAFKNLVYDAYARDFSRKARICHQRAAEKGQYWSPQTVYGYVKMKDDRHKLEKDPEAAQVVREIFDQMLAGQKPIEIVRNLNDRDVPPPLKYLHERGRHTIRQDDFDELFWDTKTIYDIVQNETYTGAVVSLKSTVDRQTGGHHKKDRSEWVRVPGMHEAIVSEDEFQTVQKMISKRNLSPAKATLPLYCGICGKKLKRTKAGTRYCQRGQVTKDNDCQKVSVNEDDIAALVLDQLKGKLKRVCEKADLALQRTETGISPASRIKAAEGSLRAAEKAKKMLFEKLADRTLDRETFKEKKAEYDGEIERLKEELQILQAAGGDGQNQAEKIREKKEEAESFLDVPKMADEIWDKFVKKVKVFPGKRIEIEWKFEDENT